MNQASQSEWCVCLCVCERERDGRVWRTRTGLVTVNAVFVEVEAAEDLHVHTVLMMHFECSFLSRLAVGRLPGLGAPRLITHQKITNG